MKSSFSEREFPPNNRRLLPAVRYLFRFFVVVAVASAVRKKSNRMATGKKDESSKVESPREEEKVVWPHRAEPQCRLPRVVLKWLVRCQKATGRRRRRKETRTFTHTHIHTHTHTHTSSEARLRVDSAKNSLVVNTRSSFACIISPKLDASAISFSVSLYPSSSSSSSSSVSIISPSSQFETKEQISPSTLGRGQRRARCRDSLSLLPRNRPRLHPAGNTSSIVQNVFPW